MVEAAKRFKKQDQNASICNQRGIAGDQWNPYSVKIELPGIKELLYTIKMQLYRIIKAVYTIIVQL